VTPAPLLQVAGLDEAQAHQILSTLRAAAVSYEVSSSRAIRGGSWGISCAFIPLFALLLVMSHVAVRKPKGRKISINLFEALCCRKIALYESEIWLLDIAGCRGCQPVAVSPGNDPDCFQQVKYSLPHGLA